MKKTFIYLSMAAFAVIGFTSCGSDDADYVPPTYDVVLPVPDNAENAVSYEEIKGMTNNGKTLEDITFTEEGNAIVKVGDKYVSSKYTYADGVYTLTGAVTGTVREVVYTSRGASSENTNISIDIEVIIDGQTYTFTGNAEADTKTAVELLTNTDLNNICRVWTVKNMSLSLSGDVSMMKTYENGDLSQLGKDANENGADKLFLTYKENGKEVTQCASWDSTDFKDFLIKEISEANKFIDNDSKVQVIYNAAGGCTITFFTEIKGNKTYKAQLIVNLV